MKYDWYKRDPAAFRMATRGMPPAMRLLFGEIIDLIYEFDGKLMNDDRFLATALATDIRSVRVNKAKLIAIGKLVETADGRLTNPRCERELAARNKLLGKAESQSSDATSLGDHSGITRGSLGDHFEIVAEKVTKTTAQKTDLEVEKNRKEQCSSAREVSEPGKINSLELNQRLTDAARPCLDDPVNAQGLASCAVPLSWLSGGCDLELDVLPKLTEMGRQRAGKRVRTWAYFSDAVYEARDQRLAGMRLAKPVPVARPLTKLDAGEYLRRANEQVAAEQEEHRRQKAIRDAEDAKRAEASRKYMAALCGTESMGGVADVAF